MPIERVKINKIWSIGLLVSFGLILNILTLKSPVLGLILSVLWLTWLVYSAKQAWGQKEADFSWAKAVALLSSLLIILGSLFFYLVNLSDRSVILIIIILTVAALLIGQKNNSAPNKDGFGFDKTNIPHFALYLIFWVLALTTLLSHQSMEAIRTPWEAVPKIFFVFYFLTTGALLTILIKTKDDEQGGWLAILIGSFLALSLSVATIVYKIGFGFDPFVHRAAEKALVILGYIKPKPFFYIGQYSLVAILARMFQIGVNWIDKLLVPVIAVLTLPGMLEESLSKLTLNNKIRRIILIACASIVTPLFFYTVPQSLANLLLLILVLTSWPAIIRKQKIFWWQWLILMAIFFIHPMSAIPGAIWLVWAAIANWPKVWQIIYWLASAASVPAALVVWQKISGGFGLNFNWGNLKRLIESFSVDIFNYLPFYSIYHWLYLYRFNILLIILIISGLGIYYFFQKEGRSGAARYLALLAIMAVNLWLMGVINFQAIIGYEQVEFVRRLALIILIMGCPLLLAGANFLADKILRLKAGQAIIIFFGAVWLTFSLYLSYPHDDAFAKGRSYAVSNYDLQAARWIDQSAAQKEYVVLANQSVSAASLQEFGFKKYFINKQQQMFYYPIPTSSPLYEIYLDIIYNGVTLDKIEKARSLTGASKVYLVINSYWLDAKKRVAEAESLTHEVKNIDNKVWVLGFGE
ncbi:MAG TPA: hypothetical protein PLR18_03850 [bacterium]|nr:hypothetical protein [bacterium]